MLGCTNDTLLMAAATMVLLGPGHAWFREHWISPSPTVKKKRLLTVCGTFAGNLVVAKLRNFLLKLIANNVSLNVGSAGLWTEGLLFFVFDMDDICSYSRIPAVVELSKAAGPVA